MYVKGLKVVAQELKDKKGAFGSRVKSVYVKGSKKLCIAPGFKGKKGAYG